MRDSFYAHRSSQTDPGQSVREHNEAAAEYSELKSGISELSAAAWLSGIFHDAGKYGDRFQDYLERAVENPESVRRGEVNHSTAGASLSAERFTGEDGCAQAASQMVQTAVCSHHGLVDCISLETGEDLFTRQVARAAKEDIQIDSVRERFYREIDPEQIGSKCRQAVRQTEELIGRIRRFTQEHGKEYGCPDLYLGLCERMLLSALIDADRTDTAAYLQRGGRTTADGALEQAPGSGGELEQARDPDGALEQTPGPGGALKQARDPDGALKRMPDRQAVWQSCMERLEQRLADFRTERPEYEIDRYRREISDSCLEAAGRPQSLYRLTVPTGAGKTLSSLRFALVHAEKYDKKRIFYIAPYNSILEQNAAEIRQAVGSDRLVLEHHCNVIHEDEREREEYERLTENWDSPIVVTTAVQLLDTLYAGRTGSVRRMNSLCNSVILFDEVQALPVRTIQLFNAAVNFLTVFCNTTVVLCSATQPLFDKIPEYRMLPPAEMAGVAAEKQAPERYAKAFQRVTLHDETDLKCGGWSVEEAGTFLERRIREEDSVLAVVNTRACARNLFLYLKEHKDDNTLLFHLSTNMCARHRKEVLKEIRERLARPLGKKIVCVSTQLIEAGVDLSFHCVVRSLAGLDSVIQAAGRCNRNGALKDQEGRARNGRVYLIAMSQEAERVSGIHDIKEAQEAMKQVLHLFRKDPEFTADRLMEQEAINAYYGIYFYQRQEEMSYPVTINGVETSLVELLSCNPPGRCQWKRTHERGRPPVLKQAFQTAGSRFEVIPEDGKIEVVAEYDEEVKRLLQELEETAAAEQRYGREKSFARKKEILRSLQPYTVGISEHTRRALGNAVHTAGGLVEVVSGYYYSLETGVTREPVRKELLCY